MKRESIHRWLTLLKSLPECRESRIKRVKQEIEGGTYLTEEKLEIAYTKLFEEVFAY